MKPKILFLIDTLGFLEISSIPILSALAKKKGHEVQFAEFGRNPKRALRKIESFCPDIVAYSICSNEARNYLEINRFLKKRFNFYSLFGGAHPTFFPRFIKEEGVDAICRGEADRVFVQFLEFFGRDKMFEVNNFSFKMPDGTYIENPLDDLVENLSELPFPDRGILYENSRYHAKNPIKYFFAGRGCPYNCSYCFNHSYNALYHGKGRILRTKSVTYLLNEIKDTARKYPLAFVKFYDDIFGHDREWLAEFAARYPAEIGLPFISYARPNMINDEYCRLLKKAGCFSVITAIECGNEHLRNRVLNRNLSDEQITKAFENLKRHGIRTYSLNMIGLPGETKKEVMQTIDLNLKVKADFADSSIFQPYPGTKLTEYCKAKGYVDPSLQDFPGQFSTSVLNVDQVFKNWLYVVHKLFPLIIDRPKIRPLLKMLSWAGKYGLTRKFLDVFYRFYFAHHAHRRAYGGKIPLLLRLRGAAILLWYSKSRV